MTYVAARGLGLLVSHGWNNFFFTSDLCAFAAFAFVIDQDKGLAKTLTYYSRGDSFGESAILNGCKHQSTVVSQVAVQLLVLTSQVANFWTFFFFLRLSELKVRFYFCFQDEKKILTNINYPIRSVCCRTSWK